MKEVKNNVTPTESTLAHFRAQKGKMNVLDLSYAVYTITTPLRSRAACIPSLSIYVYVPVYPFQVK